MLHFLAPGAYERIMPPSLPLHRELVYLSGAAEILADWACCRNGPAAPPVSASSCC